MVPPMNDPGPVTAVRILGEEYWVRGGAPERVQELAAFVDAKFREVSERASIVDLKRLAVLVSMTIAEEIFTERERASQDTLERGQVGRRVRECRGALEKGLTAGSP